MQQATTEARTLQSDEPKSAAEREFLKLIAIDSVLTMVHPYGAGPRPRAGARVRRRTKEQEPGTVVAVMRNGKTLVVADGTATATRDWPEDLQLLRQEPRSSLGHVLSLAAELATQENDSFALNVLMAHFNGANGERYRSPLALGWLCVGFFQMTALGEFQDLAPWVRSLHADAIAMGESVARFPHEIRVAPEPHERRTITRNDAAAPKTLARALQFVAEALECHRGALETHESGFETVPGELAYDPAQDVPVVVLGAASGHAEPDWVHVIDEETSGIYEVRFSTLDGEGALLPRREFLEILRNVGIVQANEHALRALLDESAREHPLGQLVTLLSAGIGYRVMFRPRPSRAKRLERFMLAMFKMLPVELRPRAVAALPELVMRSGRGGMRPMADVNALRPAIENVFAEIEAHHRAEEASRPEASVEALSTQAREDANDSTSAAQESSSWDADSVDRAELEGSAQLEAPPHTAEPPLSEALEPPVDSVIADEARKVKGLDLEELLTVAIAEKEAAEREALQARAEVEMLRAKLSALRAVAGAKSESASIATPVDTFPTSLEGLAEWSARLAPRVVIAEKALRIASRIEHHDCRKIYQILRALHDLYWPMRWGQEAGARERWLRFLAENRLRCGPIGQARDSHRFAEEYVARVADESVSMSLHIQGNSSRDPKRCIRIYFHPVDERRELLVGSLPLHLVNSLT